jgi:hypothetical protein
MSELVERRCGAFTIDSHILTLTVFYSSSWTDYQTAVPCHRPAFDFIEYGDTRVWLCTEHFFLAKSVLPNFLHHEWKVKVSISGESDE